MCQSLKKKSQQSSEECSRKALVLEDRLMLELKREERHGTCRTCGIEV